MAGLTPQAIKTTGLTQTALADLLSQLPTARAAILIDTCYAGAFAVPDAILHQSQDRTWVGSLAFKTGRFILAGTTNEQEALGGIGGHGIFTAVILDALKGRADVEANCRVREVLERVGSTEYGQSESLPAPALRLRIQGHGERELITLATVRRTLS